MGESFRDLNQNGVTFLLTDLDVALTFMDFAEITHSVATARRNHKNARKAYDTVLRLLETVVPTASERRVIDTKLTSLRARLLAVGQQF